eukprot:scaffold1960_cov424-Pavlova_lutheri.AAC.1
MSNTSSNGESEVEPSLDGSSYNPTEDIGDDPSTTSDSDDMQISPSHPREGICDDEWYGLLNGVWNDRRQSQSLNRFEDIVMQLQSRTSAESNGAANEHLVEEPMILPRMGEEDLPQLRMRVDLDSVMGLLPLEALGECFQSSAGYRSVAAGFADHANSSFHILNGFAKSNEHMRDASSRARGRRKFVKGMVSTPRVPQPFVPTDAFSTHESSPWPFMQDSNNRTMKWMSLADIPHVLLGKIVGHSGVELKVWLLAPCCDNTPSRIREMKGAVQKSMHKAKAILLREVGMILRFLRECDSPNYDDGDLPDAWGQTARLIYTQICKWQKPSRTGCRLFEEVHDSLISWVLFEDLPDFQGHPATFTMTHPTLDALCNLIASLVEQPGSNLSSLEVRLLSHPLVYIDGKGLKDKVNSVSPTNTLHPDIEPIRQEMQGLLPSLYRVSRGLCRVDLAYEWTCVGNEGGSALLWSMGNQVALLKSMPRRWMEACKLYSNLGCTDAVDMQAHVQFWVPQPYNPAAYGEPILPAHGMLLPPRRGPAYMGKCLPQSALEGLMREGTPCSEVLWDQCWCLNIYCTGPRRLASSFGTHWALDFPSLVPYLIALQKVGETSMLRKLLMRDYETAGCCVESFRRHVERETASQGGWSLRSEVGARTIEDAAALLDHFAAIHQIGHQRNRGRSNGYQDSLPMQRPIRLPLRTIASFMSCYVKQWWELLATAVHQSPPSLEATVVGIWAEQALQSTTLLVKGQNPWCSATFTVMLKICLVPRRIILPGHVQPILATFSRVRLQTHQESGSRAISWSLAPTLVGQTIRAVQRIGSIGLLVTSRVEQLEGADEEGSIAIFHDVAKYLLRTFYSDVWHHMVSKRHWSRFCAVPNVLCQGVDTTYSQSQGWTVLSGDLYNAKSGRSSRVHPSRGEGSRAVSAAAFVDRWFPKKGHRRNNVDVGTSQDPVLKWYHGTLMLWELARDRMSTRDIARLCETLASLLEDPTALDPNRLHDRETPRETHALVPDGAGPKRVFRTLNQWQVIIGRHEDAFCSPNVLSLGRRRGAKVTRVTLRKEWSLFKHRARRGWTEHELDIFSLFVLLEGGEARLNNIDAVHAPRVTIDHMAAFTHPRKAILYCFRLRRSVEGVTSKYNDACKNNDLSAGGWSLVEMVQRIKRCLGTAFLGPDNKINKKAGLHYLVAQQEKTQEHYRCGWLAACGPVVDNSNRSAWEVHSRTLWEPPIPQELLPRGYA